MLNLNRVRLITFAAVKNYCHWTHAKYIAEQLTEATGKVAEVGYRALLKLVHLQDEEGKWAEAIEALIRRVFIPQSIVRGNGLWVSADNLATPITGNGLAKILRGLPGVLCG